MPLLQRQRVVALLCLSLAVLVVTAQVDNVAISVWLTARTGGALSVAWALSPQWLETHTIETIASFNVSLNGTLVAQIPAMAMAYDIYGLTNNSVYAVVVRGDWVAATTTESLASNELVAMTLNVTTPSVPPVPQVVAVGGGFLRVRAVLPLDTGGVAIVSSTVIVQSQTDYTATSLSHNTTVPEFTFYGLDAKTTYRVRVYVTNSAGLLSDESTALVLNTLAVQLPSPCPSPTVVNVTGGSIRLQLNPPTNDGGARIKGYVVYMAVNGSSLFAEIANTVAFAQPNIIDILRLPRPSNQPLRPSTQYDIKAVAVNMMDACINPASLWNITGEVVTVVTAAASLPEAPPAPYFLSATGGQVTLQILMPGNMRGSILSGFSIKLDGAVYGALSTSSERPYSIAYLRTATNYSVQVAATTDAGTSNWSVPLVVSTGSPSRPSSPLNVTATNITSSQALIQWLTPIDSGGISITGYRLTLFSTAGIMMTTSVPGTSTNYRLKGLAAQTTYTVKVIAINELQLESSTSRATGATFGTLFATSPGEPSGVSALTITGGAIEVAWQAPDESGGTVYDGLVYNVSIVRIAPCLSNDSNRSTCSACDVVRLPTADDRFNLDRNCVQPSTPSCPDGSTSCCVTSTSSPVGSGYLCSRIAGQDRYRLLLGGATVTSFQQLNQSTMYYFAVHAINTVGKSKISPIVGLRTSSQTAPGYPSNIRHVSATGGSVVLTWDPPKDTGGTTVVGYRVYRDYQLLTSQTVYPPYSDCGSGVLASTQYQYNVAAVNASLLEGRLGSVLVVTPPVSPPQQVVSLVLAGRAVSWLNMTVAMGCDLGGSSATSYQFMVTRGAVSIASGFFACCNFQLIGLQAAQEYQVSVRIANEVATLDWVNSTFATSSGVPAMTAMQFQRSNAYSLILAPSLPTVPDNEIVAYEIAAYEGGSLVQGYTFPCNTIIGPGLRACPSSFRIDGLSPKTTYQVTSRAAGPNGWSDWNSQSFATINDSRGNLEFVSQSYAASGGGSANVSVRRVNGMAGNLSVVLNMSQPDAATIQCDCFLGQGCTCSLQLTSSGATNRPGTLSFLDGQDTQTIQISVWEENSSVAQPSSVVLKLFGSTGAVGVQSQAVLQLSPSLLAGFPAFTRSQIDVLENSSYAKINIVRLNGSSGAITFDLETFDISSNASKHYVPLSRTMQMTDKQNLTTLWVRLIDNRYYDGTRVFGIRVRERAVNASIRASRLRSLSTRRIRIIDDEDPSMKLPATPTGLNASRVTGGEIELTWQASNSTNTSVMSGHLIQVSTPSNGADVFSMYNVSSATTFILSSLQPATLYRFQVAAWNSYGASEFSGTALILTTAPSPPSAPVNVRANVTGGSFILLQWNAPRDLGGSPLAGFALTMQGDDGVSRLGVVIPQGVLTYKAEGLSASTAYVFSVGASTTAFPVSSSSNAVANFTASTGAPAAPAKPPPPTLMRQPTGGTLSFLVGEPIDLGGTVIADYGLYLRKVVVQDGTVQSNQTNASSISAQEPFQIVCSDATPRAINSSTRSCTVYKLVAATDYEAYVVFHNSAGSSAPSSRVVFHTSSTVELPTSPMNFRATRVTAGNIYLAWELPQDLGGAADVIGYTVFQSTSAYYSDSYTVVYDGQDSTDRQVAIKRLIRGNTYAYTVIAQTAASYCVNLAAQHMTDFIRVTTVASSELSSPQALVRVTATGGSVTIGWREPDDLAGVPLSGYIVELLADEAGSSLKLITPEMLNAGITQFTHYGLDEQTAYHYAVTAVNQDGRGARSVVGTFSTEVCSPPQGVVNAQVNQATGGRFSIGWSPPLDLGGRPIQYYQVRRQDQPNQVNTVYSTYFNDRNGLIARTEYVYLISAFNGRYSGQTVYLPATTGEPSLADPPVPTAIASYGGRIRVTLANNEDIGGVPVLSYEVTLYNGVVPMGSFTGMGPNFTFTGLTANTEYQLRWLAVNEVGRGSVGGFPLSTGPVDLPSAPPPPTAFDIHGGSLWLTVYPPSYNGGDNVTLLLQNNFTTVRNFSEGQVSTFVSALAALTEYRFRVVALNSRGQTIGEELTVSTIAISQPSAVVSVQLVEVTFDRMSISWPPVVDTGGDGALQYDVTFFSCDASGSALASSSTFVVTTPRTSVVLTSLNHSTRYNVGVRPLSSTGLYGDAGPIAIFTTEEPLMGRIIVLLPAVSIQEGNATVSIPLTRVEGSFGDASYTYQVLDETAVAGVNYDALGTDGSMATGVKNGTITIALRDDDVYNPTITFIVKVWDVPSNTPTQTRVTIQDDGDAGFVSFAAVQFQALESAGVAYLPITRNGGSSPVAVLEPYIVSAHTALSTRFKLSEPTFTFEEGATIHNLAVLIEDDSAFQYWPDSVRIGFRVLQGGVWVGAIASANLTAVDDGDVSPPKEIMSLKVDSSTGGSIQLLWSPPVDRGGLTVDLRYAVQVFNNASAVVSTTVDSTSTTIYGLSALTVYQVAVSASNVAGVGAASNRLVVSTPKATPPTAPLNVSLLVASSSTLLLSWSPPQDAGGASIVSYSVYRVLSNGSLAQFPSVSCSSSTVCSVKGLEALTAYSIQVRANSATVSGTGELSIVAVCNTSTPDVPDPPPVANVTWVSAGAMTIQMFTPVNVGGSDVQQYLLMTRGPTDANFIMQYQGPTSSFTMYRLNHRSSYDIKYQVINSVGASDFGPVLSYQTLERSIVSAPLNLTVVSATGGAITLSWVEPRDIGGREITGYTVMIQTPLMNTSVVGYDGKRSPNTNGVVYGLTANTTYTMFVIAYTEVSSCYSSSAWFPSASVQARTALPTLPTPAPSIVLVRVSGGIVELTWSPPIDEGGVPITGYTVMLVSPTGKIPIFWGSGTGPFSFVHNDLIELTEFTYVVKANSTVGDSLSSDPLVVKTLMATAPSAPLNVRQLQYVTGGAIQIGWDRPIDTGGQPLQGYWVYRDGAPIVQNLNASVRSYIDKQNLRAGTSYGYTVRAVSWSTIGSELSSPLSAKTSAASNPQLPSLVSNTTGASFLLLAWTADPDTGGVPVSLFEAKLVRGSVTLASYVGVETSFRFTRLTANTTYSIVLTAYNQVNGSVPLTVAFMTLPAIVSGAPPAPVAVVIFGGNLTVEVTAPVDTGGANITDMRLYEANLGFLGSVPLPTDSLKVQFTVFGLVRTTDYSITTAAVNRLGEGMRSPPLAVRTGPLSAPGAVRTAPNLTAVTGTTISIVWTVPVDSGGDASLSYEIRFVDPFSVVTAGVSVTRLFTGTTLKYLTFYTVSVRVVNVAGKSGWSPTLTVQTLPDAAGEFNLDATAVSVLENAGKLVLNVRRSNGLSGAVSIVYAVQVPTANASTVGKDFALIPDPLSTRGTITFASLQVSATITIFILPDDVYETPDEQFTVVLVSASLTQVAPIQPPRIGANGSTVVTILDDGDAGTLSFTQARYTVREDNATFDIPIVREGGKSTKIELGFTFADGTAIGDRDYRRPTVSTLTMDDGKTAAVLRVSIINDKIYEYPDEFFTITMAVTGGARLNRSITTVVILDDGDLSLPATPPAPVPINSTGGGVTLLLQLPSHNGSATELVRNYLIRVAVPSTNETLFNVTVPAASQAMIGRLVAGTAYSVSFAAANSVGFSAFSANVSFSTTVPTLPGPVVNVSVIGRTGGSVHLAWLPPEDTGGMPITKYRIYRVLNLTSPNLVAEFLQPNLRGAIYGLTANTTYLYAIQAGNGMLFPVIENGWGALGPRLAVQTSLPTLAGPTRMLQKGSGNATGGSVSIAWAPPLDTGGIPSLMYEVYARRASSTYSVVALVTQSTSPSATIEGLYASSSYEIFVLAVSALRSSSLDGLGSCATGSKALVTTEDLSKRVLTGSVLRVGEFNFLVGDMANATKGTLPLANVHEGRSISKQNITAIGNATAFISLSTLAASIPQVPRSATLVNATGGAIAFRVDSPDDTGGVPIESFTVLVNGTIPNIADVRTQLISSSASALTKTLFMRVSNLHPQTAIEVTAIAVNSISLCDFKTKTASVAMVFETTSATPPEPPQIGLLFVTGGGLKFSLSDPFDTGGPAVTQFLLYKATNLTNNDWELASIVLRNPADKTRPSTVVARLKPQTKYYFRMSVSNGVFESANSSVVSFSTSSISPPGACEEPRRTSATGGMLTVEWADPPDNGGAAVIDFTIVLQPASATGMTDKRIIQSWVPRSYTFYGLSATTNYSVSVKARNAKGTGPDGPVATLSTIEGTPPNGSIRVKTAGSTGGAAMLLFNEPLDLGGTSREDMQYRVFVDNGHRWTLTYNDLATSDAFIPAPINNGTSRRLTTSTPTGVVVGGLDPLSLYNIQIQPVNNIAAGAVSGATLAATTEATIPSAPRNVQIPTINGGSVELTWMLPADMGGLPLLYYVVYMGTTVARPFTEVCRNQATLCRVASLSATTNYWFYVVAVNAIGTSFPSSDVTTTTLSISRPSVPGKVKIVSVSEGTIVCEWTAPIDAGGSTLTGYTVNVSETNSVAPLRTISSQTTNATIAGLSPATQYSLTVIAANKVSAGDASAPQFVTTATAANTPTDPIVSCFSKASISLLWYPHPSGTQYRLLRNGTEVYANTTTHYVDTNVVGGLTYEYKLEAMINRAWANVKSSPVSVTTSDNASNHTCLAPQGYISEIEYKPNAAQIWLVKPEAVFSTLTLEFTLFDLECDHDSVRVENADNDKLLWQGGCSRVGTFIVQSSTAVRVLLAADATVERRGFELYYETDRYPVADTPTRIAPPQSPSGAVCSGRGVRQMNGTCQCSVGFTGEGCSNHIVCCSDPTRCTHEICARDTRRVIVVSDEFGDDVVGTGEMMNASETGTASKAVKTLSQGLNLSTNGDTVFVYPGVYKGALNRELRIAQHQNITIVSLKGFAWTGIDCEMHGRAMNITQSNVVVDGLTIRNGLSLLDGGAITLTDTNLTLRNVLINTSVATSNGGAIAAIRSMVSATGVRIERSTALKGGGVSLLDSQLMLAHSNITFCQAHNGGAAMLDGASTILGVGDDALVSKNTAIDDGGGVLVTRGIAWMQDLEISENGAGRGGGVAALDGSQVQLNLSKVNRNKALTNGGGVALLGAVRLTGSASNVSDNVAVARGGGLYVEGVQASVAFSTETWIRLERNQAVHGAGIAIVHSHLTIAGAIIKSGMASETGGGMEIVDSVVELTSSMVSSNTATTTGGGLHALRSIVTATDAVHVVSNKALLNGGGLYLRDSSASGNLVVVRNSAVQQGGGFFAEGTVSLLAVLIRGCTASDGGGGFLSGASVAVERIRVIDCVATAAGGGMALAASALTVLSSEIQRCSAVAGGGVHTLGVSSIIGDFVINGSIANDTGGALYATEKLTLSNIVLLDSTAARGGCIFVERASVVATNVTVLSCSSTLEGGGWNAQASSLTLKDVRLAFHKSNTMGGGLAMRTTDVVHDNVTVVDNSATTRGGGVSMANSTFTPAPMNLATTSYIADNQAHEHGGNVYVEGTATAVSVHLSGGKSGQSGGGIAMHRATVSIRHSSIFNNYADQYGGGLSLREGSTCDITDSTISDNVASVSGGGASVSASVFYHNHVSFQRNVAPRGGAVYLNGTSKILPLAADLVSLINASRAIDPSSVKGVGSAMYIATQSDTEIAGLHIHDGVSEQGGVFVDGATLTLHDCEFVGNNAAEGAALYASVKSVVTITNANFTGNTATLSGGAVVLKGLDAEKTMALLSDCVLTDNEASKTGGAIAASYADVALVNTHFDTNRVGLDSEGGGAIAVLTSSALNATDCRFINNRVFAAKAKGAALYLLKDTATRLERITILGDDLAAFIPREGGAVYLSDKASKLSMVDCEIATSGSFAGGAVYVAYAALTLLNTTLRDCSAVNFGGGVYVDSGVATSTNCTLYNNSAQYDGGGFYVKGAAVVTVNTTVLRRNLVDGSGGGLYVAAGGGAVVVVTDSSLVENTNRGIGSAIFVGRKNNLTLTSTEVRNNGGADAEAGALYVVDATVVVDASIFIGNRATIGAAIVLSRDAALTMTNSHMIENHATTWGGALYMSVRAIATILNSTLRGNNATTGGAAYLLGSSTLTVRDTNFTLNRASGFGGVITIVGRANATISSGAFTSNVAYTGGVLAVTQNASVAIASASLTNNSAVDFGGAIYVDSLTPTSDQAIQLKTLDTRANAARAGRDIYWVYHAWFVLACESTSSSGGLAIATSPMAITAGWWPKNVTSGVLMGVTKRGWVDPLRVAVPTTPHSNESAPVSGGHNGLSQRQLDSSASPSSGMDATSLDRITADPNQTSPFVGSLWPTLVVRDYYGAIADQDNRTQCLARKLAADTDDFQFYPVNTVNIAHGYVTFDAAQVSAKSRIDPFVLEINCTLADDVARNLSVAIRVNDCDPGYENADGHCIPCRKSTYSLDGVKCHPCPLGASCETVDEKNSPIGVRMPARADGFFLHDSRDTYVAIHCREPKLWDAMDPCREVDAKHPPDMTNRLQGCSDHLNFTKFWPPKRIFACLSTLEYYACDTRSACVNESAKEVERVSSIYELSNKSQCNAGYGSVTCATCTSGFYKVSNGTCKPCSDPHDPTVEKMTRVLAMVPIGFGIFALLLVWIYFANATETEIMKQARAARRFQVYDTHAQPPSLLLATRYFFQQRVTAMMARARHSLVAHRDKPRLFQIEPRAVGIPAFRAEKFKILLGFFQVIGGFKKLYEIPWPNEMSRLMDIFSIADFSLVDTTGIECFLQKDYFSNYRLSLIAVVVLLGVSLLLLSWGVVRYRVKLAGLPRHCVQCGLPVFQMLRREPKTVVRRATMVSLLRMEQKQKQQRMRRRSMVTRAADTVATKLETLIARVKIWWRATRAGRTLQRFLIFVRLPASSSRHHPACPTSQHIATEVLAMVVRSNLRLWRSRVRLRLNYQSFQNKCIKLLFWILLLFYPELSQRVVGMFYCDEIGRKHYMSRDKSHLCYEGVWLVYVPLTIVLMVVWVVGVPLLFWTILFLKRRSGVDDKMVLLNHPSKAQLKQRLLHEMRADLVDRGIHMEPDKLQTFEKDLMVDYLRNKRLSEPSMIGQVGFIYHSYRDEFWWFEVWDLTRKLFLNCVVGLLAKTGANRIIAGLIVFLIYLSVMLFYQPFREQSDSILAGVTQIQLFITLFCGLLLKLGAVHMRGSVVLMLTYIPFVSNVLTMAFAVGSIVYEKVDAARKERRRAREEYRRAVQKHVRKLWRKAIGWALTEVFLLDDTIRPMPFRVILELARRDRDEKKLQEMDRQLARSLHPEGQVVGDDDDSLSASHVELELPRPGTMDLQSRLSSSLGLEFAMDTPPADKHVRTSQIELESPQEDVPPHFSSFGMGMDATENAEALSSEADVNTDESAKGSH